ncbi:MAG TPA: hypothetical protein VJ376_17040 [Pseudomonadota bacterium]|nr:hypothetical protein [Pseudomonadota bacterium]
MLYVRLSVEEHTALGQLAANTSAANGRLVSVSEVVRQLLQDALQRKKAVGLVVQEPARRTKKA